MNDQYGQAIVGLLFLLLMAVVLIVCYLIGCAILWRLGRKFQDESFFGYCIPIYNYVLLCRCAGVSGWHGLLLCLPVVNYGAMIWIFGNIARRMGKSFWGYGLGAMFFIPTLVLAFGNGKPIEETDSEPLVEERAPLHIERPVMRRYLLNCVQGEIAGSRIEIPEGSIVIGRSPQQAQIVLSHPHVSSSHARLWTEAMPAGVRIWMEDLQSTNGTSVRRSSDVAWTPLKGAGIPLNEGDMIRIADGVADFQVVGG